MAIAASAKRRRSSQMFRPSSEENTAKLSSHNDVKVPDPRLSDGMPLPKYLREKFPRHLFGMPIIEIDKFYHHQKTFVIVSSNWVIHRFSALESLWVLSPFNRLRWILVRIITHSVFEFFMFTVVLSLAIVIPVSQLFEDKKPFFLPYYWIFTIEVLMKILAHGFFLKSFSYLRNPWNWMDLILTCAGWYTECFAQDGTLYGIQSLRVLRIIHFFTYPRLLFARIFRSLCLMKELIVYGGFVFCVFTMFAFVQYQGVFMQNCKLENETGAILDPERLRSKRSQNISTRPPCPDGFICLEDYGKKPSYCLTNFDNLISAGLGILRVISREYWDHLFAEITATSTPWHFLFFICVIVFGSYLLTNLTVGYIAVSLNQFMDILAGKLPKNEHLLLVTDIQEYGNATDSNAANNEQAVVRKTPRNSVCRFRNDNISLNNLNVEGDRIVSDELGNDQEFDYSDNESYVGSDESEESRSIHLSSLLISWVDKLCIWQCCVCWTKLQKRLSEVILNRYFSGFICLCITTNIVILTLDQHEMPESFAVVSYYSARIFTLIYLVEAALKILALSPKYYLTVSWNVFEFLIAIGCLLELSMEITGISGLAVMRSFRMFRILRFARWWPGFGSLMKIVTTNSVVFFVVVLLFATIGVFLFGKNYETSAALSPDEEYPRWHTIDFTHSLLLVVRILCGEWLDTLTTCTLHNGWPCIPFFLAVVAVGNLVLFHLFITMLMAAIQSNNLSETQLDSQQNLFSIIKDSLLEICSARCSMRKSSPLKEIDTNDLDAPPEMEVACSCEDNSCKTDTNVVKIESMTRQHRWDFFIKWMSCHNNSQESPNVPKSKNTCWRKWETYRQSLPFAATGRYFNAGMTAFIVISTIPLCLEGHSFNSSSLMARITYITDIAVLLLFILEFITRILIHGIKNYFNDNWLCFDFVITSLHVVSLVTRTLGFCEIPFIALRPLKLIPRIENLRVVVATLTYRLSLLLDSILACGVFWLVFCLTGMQLFARKFYRCVDSESRSLLTNDGLLKDDCTYKNFTWANANINFDNIQNSFIALLHVATLKGWIPILYSAIDVTEAPFRPLRDVTIHFGWFFVLFLVFGVFCCFALILSAFVKRTNDHMQKAGGYAELLMTVSQRKTYVIKSKTFFCAPAVCMPGFKARKVPFVVRLLNSRIFTLFSIIIILASSTTTVILYCPSHCDHIESLFGSLDLSFFLIFVLEVVLKLTVFGRQFFGEPWNIYDIVIIAISTFCYIFLVFGFVLIRTGLLSVLRVVRLIRWLKPVQRIVSRIWALTPAILNVGALLVILMVSYAIIGMIWFHDAQFLPEHDAYHNFKTFFPAMITLSEMSLGSGWDFIYAGLAKIDQGSAAAFVMSYLFMCYFIVIGFGIVLFLENYHLVEMKLQLDVTDEDVDNYVATWQLFDPRATGVVNFELLSHLLDALNPRLQISQPNVEKIDALNIPIVKGNFVAFEDVFEALLRKC